MSPQRSGLSTFEWLSILGFVVATIGASMAWAINYFPSRVEFNMVKDALDRIEDRQEGKKVVRPHYEDTN